MHRLLQGHQSEIEKYGIQVKEDDTLLYPPREKSEEATPMDLDALQNFGSHLIRKLSSKGII